MRTLSPPTPSSCAMASLASSSGTSLRGGLTGAGRRGISLMLLSASRGGRIRRLFLRLHHQSTARALEPDIAVVSPTIKITAALVLSDKGHQSVEHVRHGTGRLSQSRLFYPPDPPIL